jgi:4-hydroxybutyrate CoA-transferase
VINNATKRQHAGLCVTTMAAGSPEFYRYLHANPAFAFHPCSHTHAAATLSAIEGLCCINSVLQVDLNGNANAETVGGRLISTPGGLLDFAQGACLAPRGKSIIALRSANRDATVSSIVTALESAAPRSLQATDIDYIVTEYGVARVRGESPESLRRNLRAIAHPHFRDTL